MVRKHVREDLSNEDKDVGGRRSGRGHSKRRTCEERAESKACVARRSTVREDSGGGVAGAKSPGSLQALVRVGMSFLFFFPALLRYN